jgi:bifunctional DNA-binding transcriptional regulator/antitoxin component of YhaV-PrlF toxin-antitoxin module
MEKNRIASALISGIVFASMSSLGTMPAYAGNLSELSTLGTVSVIGGSMVLVASPFIIVGEILTGSSTDGRNVEMRVTTDKGQTETIKLPKETCDKVGIKQGDRLQITPNAAGALISKENQPVAYLVTPDNANLSRNHELAR